jgi:hypothetical protein
MTRDRRPTDYDDATIEQLVRDVAGEWTMPPVRLDAPSWRARVRSSRGRRLSSAGGWFGRLGQAASAAVALTVVAALVAVILTRPSTDSGKPPASPGTGPSPTAGGRATALPKIWITGEEPDPTIVVVRTERGDFARVDLSTGLINGPLTGKGWSSALRVGSGGAMVCLCVEESGSISGQPTDDIVTFERYDPRGKLTSSLPVERFSGEPDPRDEGVFVAEHPAHVLTEITYSADGRYAFVGWSERAHPVWHSGIVVVDMDSGAIVSRLALPDATDGEGDTRRVVGAPKIAGSIGGGALLIARGWYQWAPAASQNPAFTSENEIYRSSFADGAFGDPRLVPTGSDCGSVVNRAGALPDGGFWLVCSNGGLTVVRRLGADNALLGDVHVAGGEGIETDPTAVSADGKTLFVWDPSAAALTRVDLATAHKTTGNAIAAANSGPLAALGDWLAPSAAAKSWLRGALVISPDGTRIYAIGVRGSLDEPSMGGSTGIFAFDGTTLEPVGSWPPTADFVSVAVSADGRFVYAAGLPSVDATGESKLDQQASITVFDTTDGSVRLIAGKLGGDALTFISPTLD